MNRGLQRGGVSIPPTAEEEKAGFGVLAERVGRMRHSTWILLRPGFAVLACGLAETRRRDVEVIRVRQKAAEGTWKVHGRDMEGTWK
jgi:hypothetical protein